MASRKLRPEVVNLPLQIQLSEAEVEALDDRGVANRRQLNQEAVDRLIEWVNGVTHRFQVAQAEVQRKADEEALAAAEAEAERLRKKLHDERAIAGAGT